MNLYEELQKILEEFNDLNSKLMQPDKVNSKNFQIFSARISQLTPLTNKITQLNTQKKELEEANFIINNESDKELIELAEAEAEELEENVTKTTEEIKVLLTESDPNDVRNGILEIRAGTGGEEAALFAGDLYRMYLRFAEKHNWKITQLSSSTTGNGGFKEVIAMVTGDSVYGKLKYENGVHRVQRVPTTESSGRIHTSAVSVVLMPEVDDIDIEIKDEDLRIDVFRAGGPGGQSVNTTDSAVRITHIPTDIVVSCQDEKSQHKNKARALSVLKSKIFEIEQERIASEKSELRQSTIKGGDRSAKIRTYNFPQSRVTDHRIKQSWYNLSGILNGEIEEIIEATQKELNQINFE